MYNTEIRPLIEPRWGAQDECFTSDRVRAFMTGFCAALDFVPLLGHVNRWSALLDPIVPRNRMLETMMPDMVGSVSVRKADMVHFVQTQLANGPCPDLQRVTEKDVEAAMSTLLSPGGTNHAVPTDPDHYLFRDCRQWPDVARGMYSYRESETVEHLERFFRGLVLKHRHGMVSELESECYKGYDPVLGRPHLRGRADLALWAKPPMVHLDGEKHAITGLVCELKSDATVQSACGAFVQVMQYLVTDTVLDHMHSVAQAHRGLTPWTVAMIGAGTAHWQLFAVSLPVLQALRHHVDTYSMPSRRLPLVVLTSAAAQPVLPPHLVLVSHADPFMTPQALVDWVQVASWVGAGVSRWAGVGGTACEAEVRKELDTCSLCGGQVEGGGA